MDHFGEYLRRERKLRNISLEEIAQATKISLHLLQAIEEAHLKTLPTDVYVKGFLRAYSRYVGLDDNDVVLRYEGFLQDTEKGFEPPAEQKEKGTSSKLWIALMILIIAIGTSFFFVLQSHQKTSMKTTEGPASTQKGETASKDEISTAFDKIPSALTSKELFREDTIKVEKPEKSSSTPKKAQKAVSETVVEDKPAEVASEKASLVLEAQVMTETWIRYLVDDNPAKEILLQPEELFVWKAKDRLKLTIGNAGGVAFKLNGQPMEPLGEEGEVIHLELPKKKRPSDSGNSP